MIADRDYMRVPNTPKWKEKKYRVEMSDETIRFIFVGAENPSALADGMTATH